MRVAISEAAQVKGKTLGKAACGFSETGWRAKVQSKSYPKAQKGCVVSEKLDPSKRR